MDPGFGPGPFTFQGLAFQGLAFQGLSRVRDSLVSENFAAALECTAEGEFIGVLEVATHGQTAGDARDGEPEWFE